MDELIMKTTAGCIRLLTPPEAHKTDKFNTVFASFGAVPLAPAVSYVKTCPLNSGRVIASSTIPSTRFVVI